MSGFRDASGTIATGGTSQMVFEQNMARGGLIIENTSDTDMWINFKSDAAATGSFFLEKVTGSRNRFRMTYGVIVMDQVNIFCASSGKTFTAKEF